MDRTIEKLAKVLKENLEKLGVCVDQLCDVVLQHEKRLQELEKPLDIKTELACVKAYVLGIQDPAKRNATLAELVTLCNVLGIEDLEEF